MSNFSLFTLTTAFRVFDEKLELATKEGELIEISPDEVKALISEKGDACAEYFDFLSLTEEQIKSRIASFETMLKVTKNKRERYKAYLAGAMEAGQLEEIVGTTRKISFKKNPPSVNILDESLIPGKYKTVVQTVTISKAIISDDLKAGIIVPGAELKQGKSLKIK